jgi:hypothetical protein
MNSIAVPASPKELHESLCTIFPEYDEALTDEGEGEPSFHSVLIAFTCFFGSQQNAFSDKQLTDFGSLVNAAVAKPGLLESAFSTCFLEHLHQIKARKILNPFLSNLAKQKCHA